MLLVKAGKPVDDFMELVIPYLEEGDIIIDGGNSHFPDSIRRRAPQKRTAKDINGGTGLTANPEPIVVPQGPLHEGEENALPWLWSLRR